MKWTQYYFNECEKKDFCFGVPGNCIVLNILHSINGKMFNFD